MVILCDLFTLPKYEKVGFDAFVTSNGRKPAACFEHVHRSRLPVILRFDPRESVTRGTKIFGADMRHAVSGANDLDLSPEFPVRVRCLAERVRGKQRADRYQGNPGRRKSFSFHFN